VKFEQGKIDISFNEHLSKDFIKNLSQKLIEWTGKRWIITLSKDQGQTTVHEIKQQVKAKLIKEMKQTDEYKKILEAFPDAELIDVQDKEED
jgi:DNA polymerase III subunit gamma/tau